MTETRRIYLTTDDPEAARRALRAKRRAGETGWDMAEVRNLPDPPKTASRYVVFKPLTDESTRDSE